jgi:hypothetical protein
MLCFGARDGGVATTGNTGATTGNTATVKCHTDRARGSIMV